MAILPPPNYNLYADPYADFAWQNAPVYQDYPVVKIQDVMFLLGLKMINVGIDPETLTVTAHNKPENMNVIISAGIKKDGNFYYIDYPVDGLDFKKGYITKETIADHIFLQIKNLFYPYRETWTQKFIQRMA